MKFVHKIRHCQGKGVYILKFRKAKNSFWKFMKKLGILLFPTIFFVNMVITQFTHELKTEIIVLLNYRLHEIQVV
jgi:hypothetical protein